jgi:uncharacterized protein YrrD
MARVAAITGLAIAGADGRPLGRVNAVLFHPSRPQVVGIEVDPGPLWHLFERRKRYAELASVSLEEAGVRLAAARLPRDEVGERSLGFSWHDTVVWKGMPVRSAAGERVGVVHDVEFDAASGEVASVVISTGIVGDAAIGRLEVDGPLVRGFDGSAVVVEQGYADLEASGGVAKHAAAGVATAKAASARLAGGVLRAGTVTARMVGRSLRSGRARKAIDTIKKYMDEE